MEENIIEISISPAKMFDLYIKGHGISYRWVADYLGFTYNYIYQICTEKVALTEKTRQSLNELLGTNY